MLCWPALLASPWLLACAGAALLALFAQMAPWSVPFGLVALVPWVHAVDATRSWRRTLALGLFFSLALAMAASGWLPGAMQAFTGLSAPLTWAVFLAAAPLLQPQAMVWPVARWLARRHTANRVAASLTGASAWLAVEWWWPKLLGDTLGHGVHPWSVLRQAADLAGAPGLTLLLLLTNDCVAALLPGVSSRATSRRAAVTLFLLIAGWCGYGALQLAPARTTDGSLSIAVVQAALTDYEERAAKSDRYSVVEEIVATHVRLSDLAMSKRQVDLLVWPETVYPTPFGSPKSASGAQLDQLIARFVLERGLPLLFGTYDVEEGREYNAAALAVTGEGRRLDVEYHRKTELFPLTERVPAWLDRPWARSLMPWLGEWRPGNGPRPLFTRIRQGKTIMLGPTICYESLSPRHAASLSRLGANLLVTLSNDAWLGEHGARLHLVVAAFRSVETRLPQVRASNSGISALILANGDLVAPTEFGVAATRVFDVPAHQGVRTLATRWGDWLGALAGLILLGLIPWAFARRGSWLKASRSSPHSTEPR